MKKRPVLIAALLFVLLNLAIGGAVWWLRPVPAAPVEPTADADTGMTEAERIKLMEEIGYIQQE
ncbi:MAG: hypothetical protein IPO67_09820 [Deltaproteobacteria bacterium]|nr:hypothetical protein [Deltaproteobacteria bacterium]